MIIFQKRLVARKNSKTAQTINAKEIGICGLSDYFPAAKMQLKKEQGME